jgi:hypothetical protein
VTRIAAPLQSFKNRRPVLSVGIRAPEASASSSAPRTKPLDLVPGVFEDGGIVERRFCHALLTIMEHINVCRNTLGIPIERVEPT